MDGPSTVIDGNGTHITISEYDPSSEVMPVDSTSDLFEVRGNTIRWNCNIGQTDNSFQGIQTEQAMRVALDVTVGGGTTTRSIDYYFGAEGSYRYYRQSTLSAVDNSVIADHVGCFSTDQAGVWNTLFGRSDLTFRTEDDKRIHIITFPTGTVLSITSQRWIISANKDRVPAALVTDYEHKSYSTIKKTVLNTSLRPYQYYYLQAYWYVDRLDFYIFDFNRRLLLHRSVIPTQNFIERKPPIFQIARSGVTFNTIYSFEFNQNNDDVFSERLPNALARFDKYYRTFSPDRGGLADVGVPDQTNGYVFDTRYKFTLNNRDERTIFSSADGAPKILIFRLAVYDRDFRLYSSFNGCQVKNENCIAVYFWQGTTYWVPGEITDSKFFAPVINDPYTIIYTITAENSQFSTENWGEFNELVMNTLLRVPSVIFGEAITSDNLVLLNHVQEAYYLFECVAGFCTDFFTECIPENILDGRFLWTCAFEIWGMNLEITGPNVDKKCYFTTVSGAQFLRCDTAPFRGRLWPLRIRFSNRYAATLNSTLFAVGNRICAGEALTPRLGCVPTYCYTQDFTRVAPVVDTHCQFPEFTLGGKLYLNIKGPQQNFTNVEDNVQVEPAFVLYP